MRSLLVHPVFLKHFSIGFVRIGATFLITDELIVIPRSMDNINLDVLHYFAIKGTSSVKEMIVNVTKEKVLFLQFCSLNNFLFFAHSISTFEYCILAVFFFS